MGRVGGGTRLCLVADSIARELAVTLRREGVPGLVRRVAFRAFRLHRFRLFGLPLQRGVVDAPPLPPGAEFREVTHADLAGLRARRADLTMDFFYDEIDPEARAFVILVDGELAFIEWISAKGSSPFFRLGPRELEGTRIYCLPAFRRRSLHRVMQGLLVPQLRAEGFTHLYYAVHAENVAGIRPLTRSGFDDVGTGYRLGVFTWAARR